MGLVALVEGTLILNLGQSTGSQSSELGTSKRELPRRLRFPSGLRIQFSRVETGLEPLCYMSRKPECGRGEPQKVRNTTREVLIAQVGAILLRQELTTQTAAPDTS